MIKEEFIELVESAQKYSAEIKRWDDFGIDLYEKTITELGWKIFDIALNASFKEEGVDWINWWLFEKPGIFGNECNQAWDEDDKVIPTDTLDDMWNLVKEYLK